MTRGCVQTADGEWLHEVVGSPLRHHRHAPVSMLSPVSTSPTNPGTHSHVSLCGEMFGLGVLRHRKFELGGWTTTQPAHVKHRGRVRGWRHGKYYDGPYVAAYGNGGGKATVPEMQAAMGIDWTDVRHELTEAIPPAYTQWIGEQWKETTNARD